MKNLFVIVFAVCVMQAIAYDVVCEFANKEHTGYGCHVVSVSVGSDGEGITSVSGTHKDGMSNDDVRVLHSHNIAYQAFPREFKNFFPSLNRVHVCHAGITSLEKADLEGYGECLKELAVEGNKIVGIKSDIFAATPNIEDLNLGENKMNTVEQGAFGSLKALYALEFGHNACFSGHATGKDKVADLVKQIESKCSNQMNDYELVFMRKISPRFFN